MKCSKCGSESADTNTFCDWCGERLRSMPKTRKAFRDGLSKCLDGKYEVSTEDKGFAPYRAGTKRSFFSDYED